MDAFNRMRLAQYHNRRGVRMLKCAGGVDHCNHKQAFHRLAKECFDARDDQMGKARLELGRGKRYIFEVLDGFAPLMRVSAHDELEAGEAFEKFMRGVGFDCPEYIVRNTGRTRVAAGKGNLL